LNKKYAGIIIEKIVSWIKYMQAILLSKLSVEWKICR